MVVADIAVVSTAAAGRRNQRSRRLVVLCCIARVRSLKQFWQTHLLSTSALCSIDPSTLLENFFLFFPLCIPNQCSMSICRSHLLQLCFCHLTCLNRSIDDCRCTTGRFIPYSLRCVLRLKVRTKSQSLRCHG
ncbi:hypothetical protein THAPSDRAFT_268167 [Thalassiosira pseudonana CCMP1335]|uniref:Uncharacterized protein n=1 Tax=Thalassiosira pseudonana TaxID=35128 RepID=B8BTE3_THAPS|nr:hypothetical protein THAPSDRAFT_268167 [Thalassiosira pseudonana CCMP1335]EED94587.1 hypothetical protein THAPSDRAFT_268167 [Thalassiosira pseudonana CCMP1335]